MKRGKRDIFDQALPFIAGYAVKSLFSSSEKKKDNWRGTIRNTDATACKGISQTGEKEQAIIHDIQKRAQKAADRRKADRYFWILLGIIIILIIFFRE